MAEINLLDLYPASQRTPEAIRKRFQSLSAEERRTARQFGRDYFDGDRKFGYGGFRYDGRWRPIVRRIRDHYNLPETVAILDIGCAKGFFLHDFKELLPESAVAGIDISPYAVANAMASVRDFLCIGDARALPWPDNHFDLVVSFNTIHNLPLDACKEALREMQRVCRGHAFIMVNAWRDDLERDLILKWDSVARVALHPDAWRSLFQEVGYTGDYYWFTP